ncbi:adenylyl-sulfate kinase [Ferdinandcohnia sp. SAFN-114]|uniref:adenylyl-sulfate kinase n=1 Tax=Ferdinandcohnia sp. SAFN-114 TaxID=3387275 RepID=UPI003F7D7D4C
MTWEKQNKTKDVHIVWQNTKVTKEDRNQLNGHKSFILWFTGLSGAGKSTLAVEIERELFRRDIQCFLLDADNIRHGLNKDLRFSAEDRAENIRRIGEVSKLFVGAGIIPIVASISPYHADRTMVRSLVNEGDFIEIYVKCPIEECERRDPKGLYKKTRDGEIQNFTGINSPYEVPVNPEITVETNKLSIRDATITILQYLQDNDYIPNKGLVDIHGHLDCD